MKRFKYFLIIVSVLLSLDLGIASAYEPAVQWQKTFGGDSHDGGFSVQQTSDGGYIIAGTIELFGAGSDYVYLIKTDPNGNKTWQKTFSGNGNGYGQSVKQTTDGGYIIAGTTSTIEERPKYDVYLIKTDSDGNLLWQKTFGGSHNAWGFSVQQTTDDDGGYIIAGVISGGGGGDVYFIKTNSDGNLLWQKTFGGSYGESGNSVQQTTDGGYIISGSRWNIGGPTFGILIKTDSAGDSQWEKTCVTGNSVQQTTDGGFVIAGGNEYPALGPAWDVNVYLIKTNSDGNIQWQKTFGGGYDDIGRSGQQTSDGGYIIAGSTASFGAGGDVYLIKLSSEVCQYALAGDMNNDCKVDLYDFAIMVANWLIDCNIEPNDPACMPK